MAKKDPKKGMTLSDGVLIAMKALDNQVARRVQRGPAEREIQGVQKWEPHADKIEEVTALVLKAFGDQVVNLDSILVLSQAFTKSLYLLVEELGEDGLGELRTNYSKEAFERLLRDATCGAEALDSRERVQ